MTIREHGKVAAIDLLGGLLIISTTINVVAISECSRAQDVCSYVQEKLEAIKRAEAK